MTTLYVVNSGEYSDWRINGIFDDRELAELFKAAWHADAIDEYELNPHAEEIRAGLRLFGIVMYHDGTSKIKDFGTPWHDDITLSLIAKPYEGPSYIYGNVLARDEQHAAKIANEKRVQLIANGKWLE